MGLDEAEAEVEVGGDEAFVDPHRGAGAGGAQAAMLIALAGVVIEDLIIRGDFGADDVADLGVGGGAVQTGGDQDGDVLAGDAAGFEALQQGRQDDWIGRGAGDVAHGNGGGLLPGDDTAESGGPAAGASRAASIAAAASVRGAADFQVRTWH